MVDRFRADGLKSLGCVFVDMIIRVSQKVCDGRGLLNSSANLQLSNDEPLDRLGPVVGKGARQMGGKSLPLFLVAWPAHPDCGGVQSVSGTDVFAFSGFEKEVDDLPNGFLSSRYDLIDRLFTGFLVNGTKNVSIGLGKSFEYFLGVHCKNVMGVQTRQGALIGGLRKRLASSSLTNISLSGS